MAADSDLTLEKLKISERLTHLEAVLGKDCENREGFRKRIEQLLARHETAIFGDGNGNRGMSARVKELETAHLNHRWNIRTIWIAMLGVATELTIRVFQNK